MSLKILSVDDMGEYLRFNTNNQDRPEFVYPFDKFDSIQNALSEIEKSIAFEGKKKTKKKEKKDKIIKEANHA